MRLRASTSLLDASGELARLCAVAYTENGPASRQWPYHPARIHVGDAEFRLFANDEYGVIAIAGTNSLADWATNVQTKPTQFGPFTLHTGFLKSAQSVLAGVLSQSDLPDCFRRGAYWIAGHSLGGATASVLPLMLNGRLPPPKGVVAIGAPNYLIGQGGLLWPVPMLTITSPEDLVSHLPCGMWRPWARAALQVYVGDDGFSSYPGSQTRRVMNYAASLIAVGSGFLQRGLCRWFLGCDRNLFGGVRSIAEHDYNLYARRIDAALAKLYESKEFDHAA